VDVTEGRVPDAGTGVPSLSAGDGGRRVSATTWSGIEAPRLLLDTPEPESLEEYMRAVAARNLTEVGFDDLFDMALRGQLLGRGGAGFPLSRKLRAVRDATEGAPGVAHVVANGEEGEPASAKDRYLLTQRPHLVLDGLMLAAGALNAELAHVYVSDLTALAAMRAAVDDFPTRIPLHVFHAPRGYVSGEETAVVRALSGGPAKPTAKPPRPFTAGVEGRPTLVSNVETLAHLARLVRLGPDAIAQDGIPTAPGTTLITVVPDVGLPRLVEVPLGVTVRDLLTRLRFLSGAVPVPVMAGGFFGGFLSESDLDLPLSHEAFRAAGTGLGCGAFLVLSATCPVTAAADILAYFDRENAQQCGACFKGTAAMHQVVARLTRGGAGADDLVNLRRWGTTLPGRGACATLDGAARVAITLLTEHSELVAAHQTSTCRRCLADTHDHAETRFRVRWSPVHLEER
jgi:NADH:ubiquinone oxidoreductase subunit F (NADH-binding)